MTDKIVTEYEEKIKFLKKTHKLEKQELKSKYDCKYRELQEEFSQKSQKWYKDVKFWQKKFEKCDKKLTKETKKSANYKKQLQLIGTFVNQTVDLK